MLRALLVLLLLVFSAGTPGLGLETRTGTSSALLGALYAVPFLAGIAALISTWPWPRAVRWLAWVAAASAAILSALDLLGLLDPQRPPTAMVVVEVAVIAIAIAIALVVQTRPTVASRG
jgi:hypothetical protein